MEFDENKKQKSTSVFYPQNFTPIEINLKPFMTKNTKWMKIGGSIISTSIQASRIYALREAEFLSVFKKSYI